MAGGGSSKASWRPAIWLEPSLAWMSEEEEGVGGSVVRGIVTLFAGMYTACRRQERKVVERRSSTSRPPYCVVR